MFGIYGIFGNEFQIAPDIRQKAFLKMSADIDSNVLENQSIHDQHFSIGITRRKTSENKDIALKEVQKDYVMAFCGYGKFKGEHKLSWAADMLDRIALRLSDEGKDVLKQIEGCFLLVIANKDKILVVNDRFSSKNLFYHDTKHCFIFAPDVGRIISSGLVNKGKDIKAAMQFLISGFFLDNSTLTKGISRIPHASLIEKTSNDYLNITIKPYWKIPAAEGNVDKLDYQLVEEFQYLMDQSISELAKLEDRFVIPLSGGLDSRAIACFLSKNYPLATLTYDMKDEASPAKGVCRALGAEFYYLSRESLTSQYFSEHIYKHIVESRHHAVLLQYFFSPFFEMYFSEHRSKFAIFDGAYLDSLFNSAFVVSKFEFDDFLKLYGASSFNILEHYTDLTRIVLSNFMKERYETTLAELGNCDGVGYSQNVYLNGRLCRYVLESANDRINYSYVFMPGFNYDLADLGYKLSLRLRHGLLYHNVMANNFPNVMKVKLKDSRRTGNTVAREIIKKQYTALRLKLSYITYGLIKYYPYQLDYFFLKDNQIEKYRGIFSEGSSCKELFSDSQLLNIFNMTKKKQYLLHLFQRVLFIQQFYARYNF